MVGDPEQRSWVIANKSDDAPPIEQSCIVTLIAGSDNAELHVLGTAFVVGVSGNRALCICAAHSLEHVKRLENERDTSSYWYAPPDLAGGKVDYIKTERITAVVFADKEPVQCEVDQLNYVGGNDLALITVVAPESHEFSGQFAVDFAVPVVGTQVMLLCNQIEQIAGQEEGRGLLRLSFHARQGVVTAVDFGRGLPGQSASFYTTIPTTGGMSGSPVVALGGLGEAIKVIGMVSSDLSPDEAFGSFLVAGRSAMAMMWPVFGLGVDGANEGDTEPRYYSFTDLVASGFVDNRTTAAQVQVEQRRDRTKILYADAQHGRFLLETTGHPKATE